MNRYQACTYGVYACVVAFMAHNNIDVHGFTILSTLMVFDTIFGTRKAYVLSDGNTSELTTRRRKMGVITKACILIMVFLLAIVISYLSPQNLDLQVATGAVLGLFIVAEFVSIVQNVIAIRQRKQIEERDAITAVLNWLLRQMRSFLESKTNPEGLPTEPKKNTEISTGSSELP